ncbi:unnamed protein product [Parascedosporium putredinis]|uniref:DUF7598 domain-containing protein n=1 Tax=Parascedosporium putredinis TaxID=1442378 RepID=A0A9P1MBX9_9PEZI|nr:unnamed protein product [Parascedosporium putredinis]CAI7999588.1 unnamed protein product [Parascedosporium putredinis]
MLLSIHVSSAPAPALLFWQLDCRSVSLSDYILDPTIPRSSATIRTSKDRVVPRLFLPSKMFNASAIRGLGHLILNIIRACNIITLLSVAVVAWIMIVMTGIRDQFFFFDAASHFFTSCIAIVLIISEVNLFRPYFARHWPVLSDLHGFTWLGMAMIVMGCHVLGNLNKSATSPENVGAPIHRLILATGILALTFGVANIAASFLFSDRKNNINARMIRNDGNLAASTSSNGKAPGMTMPAHTVPTPFTFAGGRKLKISRPIPQQPDMESQYPVDDWRRNSRSSPILPDIKRPDTALHPMHTGVTRYSEVSHIPRF